MYNKWLWKPGFQYIPEYIFDSAEPVYLLYTLYSSILLHNILHIPMVISNELLTTKYDCKAFYVIVSEK